MVPHFTGHKAHWIIRNSFNFLMPAVLFSYIRCTSL